MSAQELKSHGTLKFFNHMAMKESIECMKCGPYLHFHHYFTWSCFTRVTYRGHTPKLPKLVITMIWVNQSLHNPLNSYGQARKLQVPYATDVKCIFVSHLYL